MFSHCICNLVSLCDTHAELWLNLNLFRCPFNIVFLWEVESDYWLLYLIAGNAEEISRMSTFQDESSDTEGEPESSLTRIHTYIHTYRELNVKEKRRQKHRVKESKKERERERERERGREREYYNELRDRILSNGLFGLASLYFQGQLESPRYSGLLMFLIEKRMK